MAGKKPAVSVKNGKVTKNAKFVKASKEDRKAPPPADYEEGDLDDCSGQDTAILGGTSGKTGGHAGLGKES